jgi:hypothetical protein
MTEDELRAFADQVRAEVDAALARLLNWLAPPRRAKTAAEAATLPETLPASVSRSVLVFIRTGFPFT